MHREFLPAQASAHTYAPWVRLMVLVLGHPTNNYAVNSSVISFILILTS